MRFAIGQRKWRRFRRLGWSTLTGRHFRVHPGRGGVNMNDAAFHEEGDLIDDFFFGETMDGAAAVRVDEYLTQLAVLLPVAPPAFEE